MEAIQDRDGLFGLNRMSKRADIDTMADISGAAEDREGGVTVVDVKGKGQEVVGHAQLQDAGVQWVVRYGRPVAVLMLAALE